MKFFALTMVFSVYSLASFAQKDVDASEVPAAVQDAFTAEFADATDVEWEMKDNQYEAEFDKNDTDYHVLFDASGQMISQKQEIEETELPAEVATAIQQDYPDFKVDDVEKLTRDGETYYQVELEKFLRDEEKVYSADGQLRDDVSYWN
jgi:uncharacterized membrane protein YkoI